MMKKVIVFAIAVFCGANSLHCLATSNRCFERTEEDIAAMITYQGNHDDDWVEVGQIRLYISDNNKKNLQECSKTAPGSIEVILYVRELRNGMVIYRIYYEGTYYVLRTYTYTYTTRRHNNQTRQIQRLMGVAQINIKACGYTYVIDYEVELTEQ